MLSYILVGGICLIVGAVGGLMWGQKHPKAAAKIATDVTNMQQGKKP